ncbi:PIN domain-containing protein [Candidatus Daviesbacteria bacterium]|nr:PIN domain-containing protein [Candidatus Daviesbacteria bacterium]
MILIDTNIILRFILNDSPALSSKAQRIFEKITNGKIQVFISLLTISEIIFTLERSYKIPKNDIIKSLSNMFLITNLKVEKRVLIEQALSIYVEKNISFPDAYHVVFMNFKQIKQIYSFDEDFDKFPQIKRLSV